MERNFEETIKNQVEQEGGGKVLIEEVPNWHFEAGTPLWELGKKVEEISVVHESTKIELPPEVEELKKNLDEHISPTFFNGPFVNTEGVSFSGNSIKIETKETDLFSYVTADYFYRDKQSKNPIRPLAVQATLFSPGGDKIILERKSKDLTDMPGKLTVFGGALKPGEIDFKKAIGERLNKKWGVEIKEENIIPTGICRENINNIYCPLFMVELTPEQYEERKKWARELMRAKKKMFYEVATDKSSQSIEKILLGKRDISQWDPLGYHNILYALVARGLRTPEEVKELLKKAKEKAKEKPFEYKYPMEKYL